MRTQSVIIDEKQYTDQLNTYKPVIAKHITAVQSKTRQTSSIPCINLDAKVKFLSFETTESEKLYQYAHNNMSKEIFPYYYQAKYGNYSDKIPLGDKYDPVWVKEYQNMKGKSYESSLIKLLYIYKYYLVYYVKNLDINTNLMEKNKNKYSNIYFLINKKIKENTQKHIYCKLHVNYQNEYKIIMISLKSKINLLKNIKPFLNTVLIHII